MRNKLCWKVRSQNDVRAQGEWVNISIRPQICLDTPPSMTDGLSHEQPRRKKMWDVFTLVLLGKFSKEVQLFAHSRLSAVRLWKRSELLFLLAFPLTKERAVSLTSKPVPSLSTSFDRKIKRQMNTKWAYIFNKTI